MAHAKTGRSNPKRWIAAGLFLASFVALILGVSSQALASAGKEIVEQRTLASKTFDNGDGTFTLEAHGGHIHYVDKATGALKECDTSLIDMGDKWIQAKASYQCEIPKYANGDFVFTDLFEDKNQTVVMRPMAEPILGEIDNSDGWVNKRVIYRNAYGKGRHLRITAGNVGLFKEIIIENKPEPLRDLSFDFEITPPSEEYAYLLDGELEESPRRVLLANLAVSGNQQLLMGRGPENAFTRIRKIRLWDSNGDTMAGRIEFYRKGSKLCFRKIVPKGFLFTATYPVYTDDTVTYYTGGGDGYVQKKNNTNWDTTHDATTGSAVDYLDNLSFFCRTGVRTTSDKYIITRGFFPFNTSTLSENTLISSASLDLYVTAVAVGDNDGEDFVVLVQTSQGSTSSLSTADFNDCGSVDSPIEGSDRYDLSSDITVNAYNSFVLNETGRGWISKTGWTNLGMREGHDVLDHPYVGAQDTKNRIHGYWSEQTGTTYDPKLSITYTEMPEPTYLKVTGSGTMNAGGSQQITITAYDQFENVATDYAGDKTLIFSGANASPDPATSPTCTNNSSADIAFGSATVVTLTNGVGTSTMKLYKAETAHIDVSDGTINSNGDASYDLDVAVLADTKSKLLWVTQPSSPVAAGATWAAFTIEITDQHGNRTSDTDTVTVTPSAGSFGGSSAKAAVAGLATFNDITYDTVDTITVTGTAAGLISTPASYGVSVVAQVPEMPGHFTHFVSEKGPGLSQDESGCLTCHAAGNVQCDPSGPLFADSTPEEPRYLANTTVCDPCHSPGGVYDGVGDLDWGNPDSVAFGAKLNWRLGGVYNETGDSLKLMNKEWCAGCHDDEPACSKPAENCDGGVYAPNVMGDNTVYGYNISGHGRSGINKLCEDCHDLTLLHIDPNARTYSASNNNYREGYRLKTGMSIPRYLPDIDEVAYQLCFNCHTYEYVFNTTLQSQSNFRDDAEGEYIHDWHLIEPLTGTPYWDSDVDGVQDSLPSCPACHNVHGSPMQVSGTLYPNPVMIRHGELVGHPTGFDFHWFDAPYWDLDKQPTPNFEDSVSGEMLVSDDLPYNGICGHPNLDCHPGAAGYSRYVGVSGSIRIDDLQVTEKLTHRFPPLYPGEGARYKVLFTVSGPAGTSYLVKSPSASSKASGANWEVGLTFQEHYVPGQYSYFWTDTIIPWDATAPDTAQLKVKLKLFDDAGLTLLDKDVDSELFEIQPRP